MNDIEKQNMEETPADQAPKKGRLITVIGILVMILLTIWLFLPQAVSIYGHAQEIMEMESRGQEYKELREGLSHDYDGAADAADDVAGSVDVNIDDPLKAIREYNETNGK